MNSEDWWVSPIEEYRSWVPVVAVLPVWTAVAAILIVGYVVFYTPWAFLRGSPKKSSKGVEIGDSAKHSLFSSTRLWRSGGAIAEMKTSLPYNLVASAKMLTPSEPKMKPQCEGLAKARMLAERREASEARFHLGNAKKEVDFKKFVAKLIH